ncbi:MAG: ABC transporter, partial [Phycicoccus sp.]
LDSRALANRAEAARVLELVDLFVWVTDPQKYADARLHDEHVRALATHEAVTMVVLNQADRLTPAEVETCRADLVRLMERDGVPRVSVLVTSALEGPGVDELRQRIANVVASRSAARARLAADVRAAALGLDRHVADAEPVVDETARTDLVDALARSAGVPLVVDAVDRDYRVQAAARTGWPVTRWVHRLRARPLRRLRLDGRDVSVSQADVRSVLWRSSLPPPTPAARAAVSLATRRVAERAGSALPVPWADAVERAAAPAADSLGDALDRAVVGTSLGWPRPQWWRVVGTLQTALALAALAGLLWLVLYAVLGWFQLDSVVPEPPSWGALPVPFVLLVGGVLLGVLLALLARWLARVGGRRRAAAADDRLREAIGVVADEQVLAPVRRVLERHVATRAALRRAAAI